MGKGFWIARGVRQEFPMSSLLFNIFFSGERNGKSEMEKGEIRDRVGIYDGLCGRCSDVSGE